jgi:uncharacterized protein
MLLFVKIAAGTAALYLIVVVLIALAQDRLLFPRWAVARGPALPATAERLTLSLASGDELIGVHLPAERPPGAALLLGFGGNAWNADAMAIYLQSVFPDHDVAAFHYRGYAPSTGEPSASAILEDAIAIHDHVVASLAPDRIVAVGLSLGAGPAAHLAERRPMEGLILVTPFDSLSALAREHYPWAPVGLLLRHRMEVAGSLTGVAAPVAVISAADDTVVPPRRTESLRASVSNLVLDHVVPDADHNDLYDRDEFKRALQEALSLIEDSR